MRTNVNILCLFQKVLTHKFVILWQGLDNKKGTMIIIYDQKYHKSSQVSLKENINCAIYLFYHTRWGWGTKSVNIAYKQGKRRYLSHSPMEAKCKTLSCFAGCNCCLLHNFQKMYFKNKSLRFSFGSFYVVFSNFWVKVSEAWSYMQYISLCNTTCIAHFFLFLFHTVWYLWDNELSIVVVRQSDSLIKKTC